MALRNQPYLPLYVDDFLTDEKLNECSALAQGVYIKLMCLMHKSSDYGKILLRQKDKQTPNQITNFCQKLAKHFPFGVVDIQKGIKELLDEEVIYIEGDTLCQKRMIKDNKISTLRANSGSKGGKKKSELDKRFANDFAIAKTQANSGNGNEDEIGNEYLSSYSQLMSSNQMGNIEFLQAWTKWILFNDERGSKIIPIQAKEQLMFLEKNSNNPEIIETAITNNWKGLKYNGTNKGQAPRGTIDFDKWGKELDTIK